MTAPSDHEALREAIADQLMKLNPAGTYKYIQPEVALLHAQSILQLIRSSLPKKFESVEEDGTIDKYVHNQKKGWYNQALDTMDKLLGGDDEM